MIIGIPKISAFIGTEDVDVWLQLAFYCMSLYFYLTNVTKPSSWIVDGVGSGP